MSRLVKVVVVLLPLIWLGAWGGDAYAANCTSIAATAWNLQTTWGAAGTGCAGAGAGSGIPGAADNATIATNVTLDSARSVTNLTVNLGATLNPNANTLTISGNITINGTVNDPVAGANGILQSTGNAAVVSGSGGFSGEARLYFAGTGPSIAAGSTLNFAGTTRIRAGRNGGATVAASVLTINGTITSTQAAGISILELYANSTIIGATGVINAAPSTIDYQTNAATLTNNGSVTIHDVVDTNNTNVWTNAAGSTLNVSGAVMATSNGVLTATAAGNTVNYNGAAQTVKLPSGAPATYFNLVLSGSGAKTMPATAMTVANDLTMSGTAAATTRANLSVNGNLDVGNGTTLTVAGFNISVAGTTSVSGTLAHSSNVGTKTYTGLVTVNAGGSWTNAGNAAITFGDGLTDNGSFAWGTGAQTVSGGNLTYAGTTWTTGTGSFTFTGGGQQIICDGTHAFTIPTLTANNTVTNNCTGGLTVSTTLAGTSSLTQGANSILNIGFIGPPGIPTLNASAIGNTVNYNRAGAQTVDTPSGVPPTYYNLTLSGSGIKTMPATAMTVAGNFTMSGAAGTSATAAGALTVGGDVAIGAGNTFSAGAFTHSVAGDFTNNGTFNANTSTMTFNGVGAQAIGGTAVTTFNNLEITNTAAAVSANTNFNVSGTLNMNGGATVLAPAAAVVVGGAGTLTGNGTVQVTRTGSGSDFTNQYTITNKTLTNLTVEYIGTAAQTVSALTYGNLKINNTSGASLAAGSTTVNGGLTLTSGTLTVGANTLILNGPTIAGTPTNLSTTSSSNLMFGGSSLGVLVPSSVTALNNLTINNANGVTLSGSPSLSGVLTLTNGILTTGANVLEVGSSCATGIVRTNGFVLGNLSLHYPTNAGTTICTFPIGDATGYTPVTVAMANVTSTLANSILTARTDPGDHPDTSALLSGIDPAKSVNRYWTLTNGASLAFSTYNATFTFVNGDIDSGANTANFIVGRKSGGVWTYPTVVTKNPNDTTTTGITQAGGFGVFAIGERAMPSITVVKAVLTYSDPYNNTTNPKSIPGAVMVYTVTVANSGPGSVDTDAMTVTDPIPANTSMCVSTLCSNPPVVFNCIACGLTYNYATAVKYTNKAGGVGPYDYTPVVPDADGFDAAVTGFQVKPSGAFSGGGGQFTVQFKVMIK